MPFRLDWKLINLQLEVPLVVFFSIAFELKSKDLKIFKPAHDLVIEMMSLPRLIGKQTRSTLGSRVAAPSSSSCLSSSSAVSAANSDSVFTPLDHRPNGPSIAFYHTASRNTISLPKTTATAGNGKASFDTCFRFKSTAAATSTYDQSVNVFPSIVIGPDRSIEPQGSFAEAQAQFLDPDPEAVEELRKGLLETNMGIVAHYYMDVELQGVLQALKSTPGMQNRVGIADSLKMGDLAVQMCKIDNVQGVICLGVDFMAESVQAILQKNDSSHVPVYRATAQHIGCSLAESAEGDAYRAWLQKESASSQNTLHVIYINTSLETKAISSSLVPTITCTSSNVLQTLLQSAVQVPDIRILYGPDTYMGENLQTLLGIILQSPEWTDEKIKADLHPQHCNQSLQKLRNNLVVFPQGNCVVHHMFGAQVVKTVRESYYDDCFMTAHLEVPGEMFEIAMEKSLIDQGVVGSTSDILTFITRKVQQVAQNQPTTMQRLKFVLGTEAGMVTSIVQSVQGILKETGSKHVEAEIIFPVASDAVMATNEGISSNDDNGRMALVPGVAGGEGCSTAGGCATCPFMKMNNLDRVQDILAMVQQQKNSTLKLHLPPNRLYGRQINGRDATDLGTEAILYMRQYMLTKQLPDELVQKILSATPR